MFTYVPCQEGLSWNLISGVGGACHGLGTPALHEPLCRSQPLKSDTFSKRIVLVGSLSAQLMRARAGQSTGPEVTFVPTCPRSHEGPFRLTGVVTARPITQTVCQEP